MHTLYRFTKTTFFIFALICAVQAGFAQQADEEWYQGKPIKEIVFSGLRNVRASELEGLMNPYIGRLFDDSIFWEIQGTLYALEYFDLISPSAIPADNSRNELILRFTVTERPKVSRITFIGNTGVKRNELMEAITIKIDDVLNQIKINVNEQAIINKYLEKGFPDVQVRTDTQTLPDSSIHLTFFIVEGDRISIEEFRFEGNTIASARTLKSQLSLKTKGIFRPGAFQEAKLIADRAAITQYYHDRGYIDAEVIDVTREVNRDARGNNSLILTFRIYEGSKYTFRGITFEGNEIFSTEQLSALIRSKDGQTVNARIVEADLQRIMDLYFENGYIYNNIDLKENRDTAAGEISFHIVIVERGRAHIENIIVRGNEKTRTNTVLREIPLEPGDVFSRTKIMDGWRNLMNLQFFSTVVPETPAGSADSLMDLVIVVEEMPTIDLQFGLTFSGSADPETFPISGMVKWQDRNIAGTGNQFGVDLNASPDTVSLAFNYNQRWIFGMPLSGGFDLTAQWSKRLASMNNTAPFFTGDETYAFPDGFASYEEYVYANKLPPRDFLMDYQQWYISLGFSTGYRWSTFLGNVALNGGFRTGFVRNGFDDGMYRPFDSALREGNNKWRPRNSFWLSANLDQRDLYYDPSNGYYLFYRLGIYGILGEIEREHYFQHDIKAEYFITLFNVPVTEKWSFKTVLAFHTGLSFITTQPGRYPGSPVPVMEDSNKLAVDGMFIGRGWSNEYSYKGLTLWENWVELRIPIVQNFLAWDFFFDAAGVETIQGYYFRKNNEGNSNFTLENMRFSFGGGLRFTIPQFPLRFSLAKRFKVVDGNVEWQQGSLFRTDNPSSGIDPVLSFTMSF